MKYATRTQAALYPVKVGGRKLVTAEFANELECESDRLTKQCVSLVEEIGQLRVELARAKKDADRLEWLDDRVGLYDIAEYMRTDLLTHVQMQTLSLGEGIDAAMEAEKSCTLK